MDFTQRSLAGFVTRPCATGAIGPDIKSIAGPLDTIQFKVGDHALDQGRLGSGTPDHCFFTNVRY
jgi:hypothetical protein